MVAVTVLVCRVQSIHVRYMKDAHSRCRMRTLAAWLNLFGVCTVGLCC
jgi:hypothetical protein